MTFEKICCFCPARFRSIFTHPQFTVATNSNVPGHLPSRSLWMPMIHPSTGGLQGGGASHHLSSAGRQSLDSWLTTCANTFARLNIKMLQTQMCSSRIGVWGAMSQHHLNFLQKCITGQWALNLAIVRHMDCPLSQATLVGAQRQQTTSCLLPSHQFQCFE